MSRLRKLIGYNCYHKKQYSLVLQRWLCGLSLHYRLSMDMLLNFRPTFVCISTLLFADFLSTPVQFNILSTTSSIVFFLTPHKKTPVLRETVKIVELLVLGLHRKNFSKWSFEIFWLLFNSR